jgi:chaperonin GroES
MATWHEAESKTPGGIHIPDQAKEAPRRATVLALGAGKLNEETRERQAFQVKVEDVVIFAPFDATKIKVEGEDLILLDEDDILAVEVV